MAQGLRSRELILTSLLLTACGDAPPDESRQGPSARSEQDPRPDPRPPKVDLAALTAEQVIDAVLEECHGPVRGGMDRTVLYVQRPGEQRRVACVQLPERLRVERGKGGTLIADGDRFWVCEPGEPARPMESEGRRRLADLREALDAATLGPLTRATAVERLAPARFRLLQPGGGAWLLTLREDTLLPDTLEGPAGTTRFVDYLHTSATWIPERVRHDSGGEFLLRFEQHDVQWDELFFVDPESRHEDGPRANESGRRLVIGAERRPARPEPGENRAMFWLVLDDPGDWAARARVFEKHWSELESQGQDAAGFVAYCREGERRIMVIPFRPDDEEGRPFVRPEGWEVRRKPREQVLMVYPRDGTLAEKLAEGERMLRQAVAARKLQQVGPVCAQPYVDLGEVVPEPGDLRDVVVRMSVPVR